MGIKHNFVGAKMPYDICRVAKENIREREVLSDNGGALRAHGADALLNAFSVSSSSAPPGAL